MFSFIISYVFFIFFLKLGLGLDLFRDDHRLRAISNFLQDPQVFEKVVQVLAFGYVDIGLQGNDNGSQEQS